MDALIQLFKKEEIDELVEMNPSIPYQKKEDVRRAKPFFCIHFYTIVKGKYLLRNACRTSVF